MRFALIVDVVATLSTACADEARSPDDGALLPVSGGLVGPLRPSPKRPGAFVRRYYRNVDISFTPYRKHTFTCTPMVQLAGTARGRFRRVCAEPD